MSEEPFRMPRPAHREADHQSAVAEKTHEEPKPVREESKKVNRNRVENNSKKPLVLALVAVIVVVLVGLGYFGWSNMNSSAAGIDGGKYQAVFFTNGQVYFGKLHTFNNDYLKLNSIFYIQSSQPSASNPQKTSEQQNSLSLIKLGNEIHGPQDEMVIAKDQVLFYENLKTDSQVSKLIDQYNSQHK